MHRPLTGEVEIAAAAAELARLVGSEAVLVTRSEAGMSLHVEGDPPVHIPAYAVKVRDVSGAGDTVAAVMAVLLASERRTSRQRARPMPRPRSSSASAGPPPVSLAELRHRILPAASLAREDKTVFDWSVLDERLDGMAPRRPADRLHQWLLRSVAPRSYQADGGEPARPATA